MFGRERPDQFKQQISKSFDATRRKYGVQGSFHWEFARRLVERAPLQSGQAVMDVATGTAPAAIMAAQIVGTEGYVIGIDISSGMLKLARLSLAEVGLENIHLIRGDAEQLMFPNQRFNGVLCSSAIVWFPDIPRALREWHRVLKLGGWIAFSCFGGPARETINNLVLDLLKSYNILYPELNEPLNTPEKCRRMVEEAGFTRVTVHTDQNTQFTTDPEASFRQAWASVSRFNIDLDSSQIAQIREQYIAQFTRLTPRQDIWNHDYEQFVIAYVE